MVGRVIDSPQKQQIIASLGDGSACWWLGGTDVSPFDVLPSIAAIRSHVSA
jgi:hypothetical protein